LISRKAVQSCLISYSDLFDFHFFSSESFYSTFAIFRRLFSCIFMILEQKSFSLKNKIIIILFSMSLTSSYLRIEIPWTKTLTLKSFNKFENSFAYKFRNPIPTRDVLAMIFIRVISAG
jgi:hypothetical protein